jgi:hypothetical protein
MWGIEEGTQTLGFALYQLSKSDLESEVIKDYMTKADSIFSALNHASVILCTINPILKVWALPYMNVAKFQFQIYRETIK